MRTKQRKPQRNKTPRFPALTRAAALGVFLSVFFHTAIPGLADSLNEGTYEEQKAARRALPIESNAIADWPSGPQINAQAAILMEAGTGTVLYAKNIHEALYPASTTKVLTCLLAAERCAMDETVTFSHEAIFSVPSDGSNAGIDEGQELSVEDCLKCILVISANEVSNGLAEHVAGSESEFVRLMNQKAQSLGCTDSHFANTNGLHDDSHYTSAHDLALITREFFKNELLAKIAGMRQVHLMPTEKQPDEIWANTTNRIIRREIPYEYYVGGKTGYTDPAHSTLVSCAEKDGMRLICIVLKEDAPDQYNDTISLFEYGFHNFRKMNVSDYETDYQIHGASFFPTTNDIFGSSRPILELNAADYLVLPVSASFGETDSVLSYDAAQPGALAQITYTYHGVEVGKASIVFVSDTRSTYEFDSQLVSDLDTYTTDSSKGGRIIFINVRKVILWIALIFGTILLFMTCHALLVNYNILGTGNRRRKNDRRRKRFR